MNLTECGKEVILSFHGIGMHQLKLDDWISLSAVVEKDYAPKFDLWYPVLKIEIYERCEAPENQVLENV